MRAWMQVIWAPGLWANPDVRSALVIGTAVAIVSAVVGVFVLIRGQVFAAHALGDVGASGAAGAFLAGIASLWGFLAAGFSTGLAIEGLGTRVRERDITTGVVMSFMMGLSALFLYWISTSIGTSNGPMSILFGSLFTVNPALIPLIVALSAATLALVALLYRPLLLSSVSPEVAHARGVPLRWIGFLFMVALVIAVEESAVVVGAILTTALIVGPAATAVRLARRPSYAVGIAAALAVAETWLGVILAYDSYLWPPRDHGWPVSFFITMLALLPYAIVHGVTRPERGAMA